MASENMNGAVKGENAARRPYLPPPRGLFGSYSATLSDNEVTDTGALLQEQKGVNTTQQQPNPEEHHADEIRDNAKALRTVKKALKKKLKKEMKANLKKAVRSVVNSALKMRVQKDVLEFSVIVDTKVRITTARLTSTPANGATDSNSLSNTKATTRRNDTVSDTDGEDGTGERPVRQKLKETSIVGVTNPTSAPRDETMSSSQDDNASDADGRGRLRRKRSHDDCDDTDGPGEKDQGESGHRRKRSRDSKAEDDTDAQRNVHSTPPSESKSIDPAEKILSPKKKRSRDQLDKDDLKSEDISEKESATAIGKEAAGEPEKKRHRDNSQERKLSQEGDSSSTAKTGLPNPFANTSSVSPFASLPGSKPADSTSKEDSSANKPVTSASAFASSSLAAFSSSEQSPFGSLASPTSSSVFKSASATSGTGEPAKGTTSSSAFTASPFAAAAAAAAPAFGSLGGGFGSATGGFAAAAPKVGGGLTSFAAPAGKSDLPSATKTKVLGQASDSEDDDEDDEEEGKAGLESREKEKKDDRFYAQQMETGEEEEESVLQNRAKLFHFDGKEWKERGTGVFRINVRHVDDELGNKEDEKEGEGDVEEQKETKKRTTARLVMRADSVLRVILNIPIFKGMKVGDASGAEPTGTHIHISGFENGKPVPLLLRVGNAETAKNIWKMVKVIIDEL